MAMGYIVITSQAVGGDGIPMSIEHYWDGQKFRDRDQAISHGFKLRGSDDFNIGYVMTPRPGAKVGALHSIWWMDQRLDEDAETIRRIGGELGVHEH